MPSPFGGKGRQRAELSASHMTGAFFRAQETHPGSYFDAEYNYLTGLEAVRNRRLWVRITLAEIGRLLGAIPAKQIPDEVLPHLIEVKRWLEGTKP